MSSPWTDEVLTAAKAHYDVGMSASDSAAKLAADFGSTFTRNSVIGIWHRKNWSGRKVAPQSGTKIIKPKAPHKPREVRIIQRMRSNGSGGITVVTTSETDYVERVPADVTPLHLGLLDLPAVGRCKFPYGEGPFTFCGCSTPKGKPYCVPHHAATHASARDRAEDHAEWKRQQKRNLRGRILAA